MPERNRIDAVIAEIQAELGNTGSKRSTSNATDEPAAPHWKSFSAAARKRMAMAQKKRWKALKAQQDDPKKTKPKATVKGRKATETTAKKKGPIQVRAAKKVARKFVMKPVSKPKAKKTALKPKITAAEAPKAVVETPAAPVEVAAESAPATE